MGIVGQPIGQEKRSMNGSSKRSALSRVDVLKLARPEARLHWQKLLSHSGLPVAQPRHRPPDLDR
jgi:hypothetical protein